MDPSVSGGDDFVWIGSPDKWFWLLVVFADEAIDGRLEIDDGPEQAVFQPTTRQDGEEAFDRV